MNNNYACVQEVANQNSSVRKSTRTELELEIDSIIIIALC